MKRMIKSLVLGIASVSLIISSAFPAHAALVETVIGCRPGPIAMNDPIVFPGVPGASHEHAFFGASGINASSTPQSLQGTATTCKTPGQTSAYWIPTANFTINHLGVYYSNRFFPTKVGIVPFGTEMVIGNGHVAADGKAAVFWTCSGNAEVGTGIQKADRPLRCEAGRDTLVIRFPNCWDGQAINTAPGEDNAHFAYSSGGPEKFKIATGGVCPTGFPNKIAQTNAHFRFLNPTGIAVSSFSSGTTATAHGDFMQSWVTGKFQEFIDTCLNDQTQGHCTGVF